MRSVTISVQMRRCCRGLWYGFSCRSERTIGSEKTLDMENRHRAHRLKKGAQGHRVTGSQGHRDAQITELQRQARTPDSDKFALPIVAYRSSNLLVSFSQKLVYS